MARNRTGARLVVTIVVVSAITTLALERLSALRAQAA